MAGRPGPVIAIVGGGASGTLAAVHLLREAAAKNSPLRIVLIDRLGRHGLGQAYATTHPDHLLNTPAERMSALAGDPRHLLRWAAAVGLGDRMFLPRRAYGQYLQATLSEAQQRAQPLSRVISITSDVLAIRRGRPLRLLLADGSLDADIAVLATGNPPPAPPAPMPPSPRCITDPWAPGALDAAADGSPVVILGTGLTMLDAALSVTGGNPRTVVHAVSRHGLLPRAHRSPPAHDSALWLPALSRGGDPLRLSDLLRQVRAAIRARPGRWQEVIDGLRPHVPGLWQRLPDRDKQLFLRHVARHWEVHRHRAPPATAARITALRGTGRLSVLAGRVTEVTEITSTGPDGPLRVRIDQGTATAEITAGWLVNATGPGTDITRSADPLIRDLLSQGLARPGPLGLGLDASPEGAVLDASGAPGSALFTLGPPLRGLYYETTAIPEIRDQAAALARHLTAVIHAPGTPAVPPRSGTKSQPCPAAGMLGPAKTIG
jgi:uncharacterized NAD(P)/FAD-binding protein YdhS